MIIVTGANGFIGSVMVWELNEKGFTDIIAVDSVGLNERNLLKKRQITKFLLKDELWPFLETDEAKKKVTWIIHMGACSSTTETNKEFLWENNTYYTQRIFEWCAEHGKSMIYASSAATYGAGELGFDDTTDPEKLRPLNLYGESKVLFDRWALKQTKTPPHWYGLKFFNVFGPNEYHKEAMSSVAFKAYNQIKANGNLGLFKSADPKYKDGEFMRDFVYVKDVTGWMAELMDKKPKNGVYNMGFGKPRTWLDLAGAVFTAMKKEMKINWLEMPENIRGQYQYFTEAKTDKWLAAGMSPAKWPLEKAVADYVQNYLSKDDPSL
ncbi:ADP-glyceromanno-heptose 6-epimerase [Bdellovibrio bacteriovorus]|uniref:ADP-L-glycero-D-manno-heptose-6-epimerase n=1 Tax=Bdellovibrio bacteriovorus TaxID=959 RepID=A0A150WVI6_BDEBC|nr:ADP-glyceromanno-heptose 6-epimerase [Bdellovibrio bacteriovorus]KYG68612.1 ADP-glyceromanno-heptose 6-epimerase [Bdellovibrio bacteriovorus]KYG70535.1 ADP-glyceromanno-heptose 6-epimerase [Bdellovibrio bacteriovorus]